MFLDFPLAFPMVDPGVALRAPDGAVHEVANAGFFGDVRQVRSLLDLAARADAPIVLHAVNAIGTLYRALERRRVLQIAAQHFDSATSELPGGMAVGVARQSSQPPSLR